MAPPATVDTGLSWPAWKNAGPNLWEVGGNLYMVGVDAANSTVEMWKSADGGNTWAEQDATNHKPISASAVTKTVASCVDGTSIAVAYKAQSSGFVRVAKFDTTTGTWGAESADGPGNLADVTGNYPLAIACRGVDDYVVACNVSTDAIMGTAYRRVAVRPYTNGVWGAEVKVETGVQQHQDLIGLVAGSSGRVHVFYNNSTNALVRHRAFLSTNAFGIAADASATITATSGYTGGIPTSYVDGANTKVVLPITNGLVGMNVVRFTSADAPTFTTQQVTATRLETVASNVGAAAVDGTTVHAFWSDFTTNDLWRNNDAGTGTWGADTKHRDAITVQGINVAKITGAIGILYADGGAVKFDSYSLSTGPQTIQRTLSVATTSVVGQQREVAVRRAATSTPLAALTKRAEVRALPAAQAVVSSLATARIFIVGHAVSLLLAPSARRQVNTRLSAASSAMLANTKRTYLDSIAAVASSAPSVRRLSARSLLATFTAAAAALRQPKRTVLAAGGGIQPQVRRTPNASRSVATATLGSLARTPSRAWLAAAAPLGSLVRRNTKNISAAQVEVGSAVSNRAYLRTFAATSPVIASVVRTLSYARAVAATAVEAATQRLLASRSAPAVSPESASARQAAAATRVGVEPQTATLRRSQSLPKGGVVSVLTSAIRSAQSRRAAAQPTSASASSHPARTLTGSEPTVATARRSVSRSTAASAPSSAAVLAAQAILKALSGTVTALAAAGRSAQRTTAATQTTTASAVRRPGRSLSAPESLSGALTRTLSAARVLLAAATQAASTRRTASRTAIASEPAAAVAVRYTEQRTGASAPSEGLLRRTVAGTRTTASNILGSWARGGFIPRLVFPLVARVQELSAKAKALEASWLAKVRESVSVSNVTETESKARAEEPSTRAVGDESRSMIVDVQEEGSDN